MSKKVGGNRVKQETVTLDQIWKRKSSGTHFIITWIEDATVIGTFTIETRKTQGIKLSTLTKGSSYTCVDNLVKCRCCKEAPLIRYTSHGQSKYYVSCDCLEFDGESSLLDVALRAWKSNMKHIESSVRSKPAARKSRSVRVG